MSGFDLFANQILEESKRFLEKARDCSEPSEREPNLHAALLLLFCALEAHINAIAEEFSRRPELSAHEKGILLEREVKLENGEFLLKTTLRMVRLEDRIDFLLARFSGAPLDRSAPWWGQLNAATAIRNQLTHAKDVPLITQSAVEGAVQAVVDALDALYSAIYKRRFPGVGRGLGSRLTF